MVEIDSSRKIKAYSEKFTRLRKDLDFVIGLNTNKEVYDISVSQTYCMIPRPNFPCSRIAATA